MSVQELSSLHERCVSSLLNCSSNVVKYLNGDKKKVNCLETIAKDYCQLDYMNKVYDIALNEFKKNPEIVNEKDGYNVFKTILEELSSKCKKPKQHQIMASFKECCKNNLDDSDIITTECTEDFIDPITKKLIEIPVKNKKCGHIYDESSIKQLIKVNPRLKCPVIGCGNRNIITLNGIEFDDKSMKKLTQSQTDGR